MGSAKFFVDTGNLTVLQTAHGATAGFCWILNSGGSSKVLVHQIGFASQHGSALVTATPTAISVERMTFTGTPSGASLTPCRRVSSVAPTNLTVRTASTGTTPSAGAVLVSFLASAALTAVAAAADSVDWWQAAPGWPLELATGEGLVIRQATNGVASDTRVVSLELHLEEVT